MSPYNLQRERNRQSKKQQKHPQPHTELTILGDTTAKLAVIIFKILIYIDSLSCYFQFVKCPNKATTDFTETVRGNKTQ